MAAPSVPVLLLVAYVAVLLVIAWATDRLGMRSAHRAAQWRTGNFLYHPDQDAWQCHEDQWLWPASFDPEKRVIRYAGQHAICGRCPAKSDCSPSPGPREITRQLDPWPHSEAGRFHRGIALCIAVVGCFLTVGMFFGAKSVTDVIVLATALVVAVVATVPLARHLWTTPANFPDHLPRDRAEGTVAPTVEEDVAAAGQRAAELIDRYATRWSSDTRPAHPTESGR